MLGAIAAQDEKLLAILLGCRDGVVERSVNAVVLEAIHCVIQRHERVSMHGDNLHILVDTATGSCGSCTRCSLVPAVAVGAAVVISPPMLTEIWPRTTVSQSIFKCVPR